MAEDNVDKEYNSWKAARARCYNPSRKGFHRYGGRGIRMCERWDNFANFLSDMGPSNGLTLDRIDNDGDYTPENCQWLSHSENSSKTMLKHPVATVDADGFITEYDTICAAAEATGLYVGEISRAISNGGGGIVFYSGYVWFSDKK